MCSCLFPQRLLGIPQHPWIRVFWHSGSIIISSVSFSDVIMIIIISSSSSSSCSRSSSSSSSCSILLLLCLLM